METFENKLQSLTHLIIGLKFINTQVVKLILRNDGFTTS